MASIVTRTRRCACWALALTCLGVSQVAYGAFSEEWVANKGLEAVAGGLKLLAGGIALAGLFISIGLATGKRRSGV